MIRCFAPPAAWTSESIALDADEARHALRVRRAAPGESVEVLDGEGHRARGPIEAVGARGARVRITELETEPPPTVDRGLIVALPKGDTADWIVEKGVELGMTRLWWVQAERSIPRVTPERRAARLERWRRTAIEALKQCGRARLPDLRLFAGVNELLAVRAADDRWLLGVLAPDAAPLRATLSAAEREGISRVAAVIGPEGDFTPAEIAALCNAGAQPVSLGPTVLRVETAALAFAAMLTLCFRPVDAGPESPT